MTDDERTEYAQGLIDMGKFLLEHLDLVEDYGAKTINHYVKTSAELADAVRSLGTSEKFSEFGFTGATKRFGPHSIDVQIESIIVCKPKKKEIKTRKRYEIPDEVKEQ